MKYTFLIHDDRIGAVVHLSIVRHRCPQEFLKMDQNLKFVSRNRKKGVWCGAPNYLLDVQISPIEICIFSTYGSFSPGRGKWAKSVIFFYFWSFTVTKRFDFFKFSQLFWRDYVRYSLKILSFTPQKFFGVPCSTPVFALLSDFWVKIRALVRPNRQRWTGFDLLIIFLVKFWWFSFFLEPL